VEDLAYDVLRCLGAAGISAGVAWGVMKAKLEQLERRQEILENDQRDFETNFVTQKHLDDVLSPMKEMLTEVRSDIKDIIKMFGRVTK
jgi:hypothetical protein